MEIARALGVSTTPVREALATLQREGLVRLHPQRGAVVFLPSVDDLREHYEIRAALEALAAAKAAERFEPAWAPPLEVLLDEMRDGAAGARATSRSTSASTRRSTSTRGRPQLVDDDRRAARRVERLPAHLPRAPRTSRPRAWTPSTARSSPPAWRATPSAPPRPPATHLENTVEHVASQAMKRSTERILTTHTGSLPRPDDLIRTMFAKQEGVPVDPAALERAHPRRGGRGRAPSRRDAGVDVVNDGEMSKPSYVTYINDRLDGFGGDEPAARLPGPRSTSPTLQPARCSATPAARAAGRRPATRPDHGRATPRPPSADIENLRGRARRDGARTAFMNAASPGVIALFFRNDHYATREEYLYAIADAMRRRVRGDHRAPASCCRSTARTSAMGRHIQFADTTLDGVPRRGAAEHRGAQPRDSPTSTPEQLRMHVCWGNYEGPHHYDVPLADIIDLVFAARPSAIAFEAANPRHAHEWQVFEDVKLPDGKVLIPGVIESTTNFIEHPELVAQRIGRYADLVGRENVIAGTDCGFGTWVGQAAVDPDVVWAKLAALAEGAALASRELWPADDASSRAWPTSDWSLPNAASRGRYFMPQSGAATRSAGL